MLLTNSLQDIVKHSPKTKSIALMRKENDLAPVKAIIKATTMDIFDHYRESYSEGDIINLTESIMRFGYMLNGLDFGLFKTKAISGEYKNRVQVIDGRNFDIKFFRLSPDVYLDWFQEYIFQRGEVFANNSHLIHKQAEKQPIADKTVEMLKELADKVKPQPIFSTDKPTESERDKFIKQQWAYFKFKFNEVWKGQGMTVTEELNPREYVTFGSKMYFQNDYIKMMVEKDLADYDKK
jgi:hypothetical protein